MGVYDRQIATAKRLIGAKGQSVTWRQITNGTPADPTKPWNVGESFIVDNDVTIAFFPVSNKPGLAYGGNTEIPTGSLCGLMWGGVAFSPSLKDVVIRDGQQLSVISVDPLNVNGESIMYTVIFSV